MPPLDRIQLNAPLDLGRLVRAAAEADHESLNAWILAAIRERLGRQQAETPTR